MDFNNPDLNGSIVLERGTTFIAKQIMLHMKLYAKQTNRKFLPYSHAETLIYHKGVMYTVGARSTGTEISIANEYYRDVEEYLILVPVTPLSSFEGGTLYDTWLKLDIAKYHYGSFLSWITYLKIGWWISNKKAIRNNCYKLAAKFSNAINRWPRGKSVDMVSIYDHYENMNYKPLT